MVGPNQMEEIMSHFSKLSAALATTSALVFSLSAANATVAVPRPTINVVVPKPAVPGITSTVTGSSSRPSTFNGKPATLQTTLSKWQGPAGAGTQDTVLIYQNGKVVGAMSSISNYPATTAPKPGNPNATPAPTPVSNQPASQPAPPAKPKPITFTPVDYPAFTDQNGRVIGYYVNGKLVTGLNGPTGGTCAPVLAYQAGNGSVSSNYSSGSVQIHAVQCYVKS
jgi:hypothetical protein